MTVASRVPVAGGGPPAVAPDSADGAPAVATGRAERRSALREALVADPLLTDADLARHLGVSVPTVRLDRVALGIPEVRRRARAVAERHLRRPAEALRGEVVDLLPGVSALALLTADGVRPGEAGWPRDPALFGDAEALALVVCGIDPASVELVNVKFQRAACPGGRLVAKAEVLRGSRTPGGRERRVVLVQIRSGEAILLRAKFVVAAGQEAPPADGGAGAPARSGGAAGPGAGPLPDGAPSSGPNGMAAAAERPQRALAPPPEGLAAPGTAQGGAPGRAGR